MIDSVFRTGKKLLSSSIVKEKKIPKYIIDNIEISSDSDRENSDQENSDEENSYEENSYEENSVEKNFDEEN